MKTLNEVIEYYNSLSDSCKIQILYSALGYMEEYNGRSKKKCIALAMGYISDWCDKTNTEIFTKRV